MVEERKMLEDSEKAAAAQKFDERAQMDARLKARREAALQDIRPLKVLKQSKGKPATFRVFSSSFTDNSR